MTTTTIDAEIATLCASAVHGREHAREVGIKLIGLFERRCEVEVTKYGDDAMIPASAWRALDLGNFYLRG